MNEKKIKLLFLIPNLGHGGAEKVLINLVNNLNQNIFDITVQTICNAGINKQFLKSHIKYKYCLPIEFPGWSHLLKLFSPYFLHKIFIKNKYDIEIAYLECAAGRIISGCKNKDTKLFQWIHCTMTNKNTGKIAFRNFAEAKKCYSNYNKIICVSEDVKKAFEKLFELNNISVLYNVNNDDIIKDLSKENPNILFDNDEFNIISVGSIKPVRAYDRLARIQKKLIDNNYNTHIYILGIGEEKTNIESYLKNNKIENTWTFLGYDTNPYKYVSRADLYVCGSLSEGLSTAVTEALYVGCPVLSASVSGAKELLGKNNEYGLIVDNNEDALYKGITKLIHNPELLEYYRKQAASRSIYFSKNNILKQHEELFKGIIK